MRGTLSKAVERADEPPVAQPRGEPALRGLRNDHPRQQVVHLALFVIKIGRSEQGKPSAKPVRII